MRIDFSQPYDDTYREYCVHCHAEAIEWITVDGRKKCVCGSCGRRSDRAIVIDPAISWWTDETGEYWHESAGVFVRDPQRRFLFFRRLAYPFVMTVPAGHVDRGEAPDTAAARELTEEVGLGGGKLRLVTSAHLLGDACRRGSDAHLWHAYLLDVAAAPQEVTVNEEGESPVWLSLDEARSHRLTFAVARIIETHGDELVGVVREG
ncbi:ADP-ribose pyrophosphatase YjhB, NUDIX family [Streptomyces sp. DvalAA-14]|uniref:NUDIX hydrolase n=1 Tax=unclassified Streptomyces TaxID=2593676 RepID=UPI00081B5D76|nr:NUDIX hydrolase [Streptomyces sp. DvalAA-14]MYS20010.1 NUDIX domain-containing protein [Streptomyces sp. SID4948]SCD58691.1 ADP-ribose pyrophosphatase YjhB, NUDIX family [Streptomyces sp. DvalAA-14]